LTTSLEIATHPGHPQALKALLGRVRAEALERAYPEVIVNAPIDHPVIEAFRNASGKVIDQDGREIRDGDIGGGALHPQFESLHFDFRNSTANPFGNLTRELFMAQQGFDQAIPSSRLEIYNRDIKGSLDRAYTAAVILLHAQVTESGPRHDALIRDAALYTSTSGKLLNEAANALNETTLSLQYLQ